MFGSKFMGEGSKCYVRAMTESFNYLTITLEKYSRPEQMILVLDSFCEMNLRLK